MRIERYKRTTKRRTVALDPEEASIIFKKTTYRLENGEGHLRHQFSIIN